MPVEALNRQPMRDLLTDPIYRAEELGSPIPPSPHAVSVALPRWQDVVDYEEKTPEVIKRLQGGYPRFVVHPFVRTLAQRIGGDRPCLPFPSADAASWCVRFIAAHAGVASSVVPHGSVWGVVTAEGGAAALLAFWQHAGLIVSSRRAEAELGGRAEGGDGPAARAALRREIAALYDCAETDVFLAPTGMAAQFAVLRAMMARTPGRQTVQLGFPYVDALKLQQKVGHGATLLHDLASAPTRLAELLARRPLAACYCEIPCNPLLGSVDLTRIAPLVRAHDAVLVVDDVLSSPVNTDVGRYADLIAPSLTKFIAGTSDVMGGAVICNPRSARHAELHAILSSQHEELLWGDDAAILEAQARGFVDRMRRHNANGLAIAERLRAHPAVERVWYPKWECAEAYEAVRRPDGGWGALMSCLPRDAPRTSAGIFDRLAVTKGPGLGAIFTLACPITLMAHYGELEWAESCGVSRHLIRLSVGLEDVDELWQRIDRALGGPPATSLSPLKS
jgi:cystathionine gamma-synthase